MRMPEMALVENIRYIVQVYVGALSALYEALSVEASKQTTSEEIVSCIVERLSLNENPGGSYELAEVIGDTIGQECKERRLMPNESPVQLMMLWPKTSEADTTCYRFYLREKSNNDYMWTDNFTMDPQLIKDYFHRFLYQPKDREYPDLCQLPDLNEQTLLENLRARFTAGHIYTYVGSILIAVNPFKFHPIYNPKYVKLYQNRRLGPNLPPHIFAVADSAYHCMLIERKNQCIVISGESGSGKTESTNFLLHHLTALSQKGSHGSGVEQTILSAGPVLEAFGNAKTAHNNNSSRFGKFIQVNYKENGMVHGAVVQKYLLEKSRICSQGRNERNYHVFYYLLAGASDLERQQLHLKKTSEYNYLNRSGCYTVDNVDESYEFSRLKQSMEMVGFTPEKQRRLFSVLSAVLLLGNVEFQPRKSAYHHDEAVAVKNPEVVQLISNLLRVKQETLLAALTAKRARASGETLVINYRLPEAIASRDAMAKCLYGALFDWIVLQVNHALLSKKDTLRDHQGNSIGVLDIFGFEDFGACNSFEQLCINYANEHLQFYFNQHVFKYEQEEYRKEGIRWNNIDFMDNTGCLQLIEGKPNGLLCVLDDQCNFPGATSETLLQKFNSVHKNNEFYEKPQKLEAAFMVIHYAGKVKYQVTEMREKNLDLMRQDIVGVLKNSSMAFVRELVGADPVAVFRWAIVRAFFRAYFAFHEAGRKHRQIRADGNKNNAIPNRFRNHTPNDNIISKQRNTVLSTRGLRNYNENETGGNNHNRLSWPQFYYHRNRVSVNAGNGKSPEEQGRLSRKDSHGIGIGIGIGGAGHPSSTAVFERVLCPDEARVMQRANQIVMKNKSFRPRERGKKGLKNLQTVKTLAGRTGITAANQSQIGKARKQPLTVAAQFQQSLHSLMDTLNQANPFFIRCIKSNGNKVPNQFDEDTVQRQLRYTGMLETVRIRQAGFNVRLTYDEFIQLYRILLPKGLLSSQNDVRNFLATLNLNRDNYQLGGTKIFLRESEKIKLDCKLHQQIMASIVTIQRWFRVCLERRRFVRMRNAVVQIQCFWRRKLAQRTLELMKAQLIAAVHIQAFWRGYKVRTWYKKLKNGLVKFQAHAKGNLARRAFAELKARLLPTKQKQLTNATSLPIRFLIPPTNDNTSLTTVDSGLEMLNDKHSERERERSKLDLDEIIESDSVLNSRIELRPTQSLPSVVTGSPARIHLNPNSSPHQQQYYNRVEDTAREGIILDTTLNKRKLSKTRNTAEMQNQSEAQAPDSLVYFPFRKCSCDSLTSYRSVESQRSSDSHNSSTAHEHPLGARQPNPLMTTMNRSEVWESQLNKSDGELDLDQDTSKSAPPVIVRDTVPRFPLYDDESCWNKPPMYSFPVLYNSPSKQIVTRTPSAPHNMDHNKGVLTASNSNSNTNTNTNANTNNNNNNNGRLEPSKRDPKREIIRHKDGLISLPPVRRDPRLSNESTSRRSNDQTGMKTLIEFKYPIDPGILDKSWSGGESLKTSPDERERERERERDRDKVQMKVIEIPTVPLRTIRKPRREIVCRSMGEEVDSGTTEAKNAALLGTIREANILGADLNPTKNIWQLQSSGPFIQHEAEMSLDTLKKSPQHLGGKRSRGIPTLDLRRRNSDPATKIGSIVEQPGGPEHSPHAKIDSETEKLVWKTHTTFTFAGHRFNKVQRFSKDDNCVYCRKQMDAFVAQGYKCAYCKKLFHTKCIQNGGGLEMPCELEPSRRKYRKHSQTPYDLHKRAVESKFNLTGTSEFTDRTDKIISDARELQLMQDFITKKIYKMESQEGKKPSEVDRVFKQALREFKDNLVATYSVVNKQDFESFNIKYKDLIANFLQVMKTVCHQEQKEEDFPVTMGVNAFRGFMNEFMTSRTETDKPSKTKRKKEKKRKVEDPISFAGHLFVLTIINIPTACEICSSFFMWPIERGLVCQSCKLTCHKKCYARVTTDCGKDTAHHGDNKRVFGVPLLSLLTGECKIPVVLDRLITTIEMHGLYTEGIYRKSGVSSKVRELKTRMEETSQDGVNFEDYQMHVLASVLKSFLREMPEPLLTFDCYEDFLRASSLTDPQDRINTIFDILRKLPKANFDLMERLIFHLARVALHEDVNRMNASALAIVFAPCVLRTNKVLPAQDSLSDIGRQTQCIETILMEQLRKVKSTLADIDTLDTACHTATHRLSSLRSSKVFSPEELQPASQAQQSPQPVEGDDEEALLVGHIQEIQKEKELLTSALPSLTRTTSDDDMLSTDLDGEGSLDDISCTGTGQSANEITPNLRRARGPVVRSVSGGDPRQSLPPKLKRQSSSDISVVQKAVEECEDAPIMV